MKKEIPACAYNERIRQEARYQCVKLTAQKAPRAALRGLYGVRWGRSLLPVINSKTGAAFQPGEEEDGAHVFLSADGAFWDAVTWRAFEEEESRSRSVAVVFFT